MNIPKLIAELNDQLQMNIPVVITMTAVPERAVGRTGRTYSLNKQANTTVRDFKLDFGRPFPSLQIHLYHNGCVNWTCGRKVKSAPHFCKYCGIETLSIADGKALGLPINLKNKPGIEILVTSSSIPVKMANFSIHNLYSFDNKWWHVCKVMPNALRQSRMTVKKFPHTCRHCKEVVGAADFNLNVAFKLPALVRK